MNNYLRFSCPHCEHGYEDDMELLDDDVLHDFTCESCKRPFVVLTKECPACEAETTFTWKMKPTEELLSALQCSACGTAYNAETDNEDDE